MIAYAFAILPILRNTSRNTAGSVRRARVGEVPQELLNRERPALELGGAA